MTPGGPLTRAVLVALAMTAVLAAILGQRMMRLEGGVEIILTSDPLDADDAAVGDVNAAFGLGLGEVATPIHPASPARAALAADRDTMIPDGWVSLKPGPDGRLAVMRVSASRIGPQPGEVVLQARHLRVFTEEGAEPELMITLPTLLEVAPDDRAEALYQPDVPLGLVLSVTPDGRALFRRVVQGDVVLVEAPGLL